MAIIPIRVEPEEIHIRADRRLAFEVVAGFGAAHGESGASSKVLRDEGQRKLVEFRTPVNGLFGRTKVYRSVEWVTLHEPERIDSEGVEGPLQFLRDRFILKDIEGCTDFRYESTFDVRWSIFGWLVGKLYVESTLKRFMRRHLRELKETIEARAKRSRVYPLECDHMGEAGTKAA